MDSYNDELKKEFGGNDFTDELKKIIGEMYEDMTDVNIQHALEESCGIIGMHFMHCDDENQYERTDADCMVAIAHEIKAALWIMVTAGNAIYKDPSDKSLEHERWYLVVNFFIMPAVSEMIMDHSLEMMYEIGAGKDIDKIKARLENMNKEFTRIRLCHPIFSSIDFAKYINTCEAMMNGDDDSIKEHVDRIYRAIHDPSILDIDLIIDKIKEILIDINNGDEKLDDIDFDIFYQQEYKLEYTREESSNFEWVKDRVNEFAKILPWCSAIAKLVKPDKVCLNAKLHVLGFLNHLIADLYTYTRHLIITSKADNEEITKCINTYSKPIADERHNLGIIVDNGGNYIDPKNTNKLGF